LKNQSILLLLITIAFASCNERQTPAGLSQVRAEINIRQNLQSKVDNEIMLDLFNEEGRSLNNDSVKIYVNGIEMPFIIRKELYYTETTYYLKAKVLPQNDQFVFEITLPDSPKVFLAKARALSLVDPRNISWPETGELKKGINISWKELSGIAYLYIGRSVKRKKKDKPNITYYEDEVPDTVKVTSAGKYTIAPSSFGDTQKQLSILSLKFIAENKGIMSTQVAKGSTIRIHGDIERHIRFE